MQIFVQEDLTIYDGRDKIEVEGKDRALITVAPYISTTLCVNNWTQLDPTLFIRHSQPVLENPRGDFLGTNQCVRSLRGLAPGIGPMGAEEQTGVTADLLLSSSEIRHQVAKSFAKDIMDKYFLPFSMTTIISNKEKRREFGLPFSQRRHFSRLFPPPALSSTAHLGQSIKIICKSKDSICSVSFLRLVPWTCDFLTSADIGSRLNASLIS